MSAVATVVRAVVSTGETPSCRICRHSRSAGPKALNCTQPRSPAINGVVFGPAVVINGSLRADVSDGYRDSTACGLAARCKFYQEEQ